MTDIIISGRGKMALAVAGEIKKEKDFCVLGNITDIENFSDISDAVIVDFSKRENIKKLAKRAAEFKLPLVSGTTGLNSEDFEELKKASEQVPVFYAPNMSMGIEVIRQLLESRRDFLKENFKGQIVELHRENKTDAPSGTAKLLKKAMWQEVKTASVRMGDFKGTHSVILASDGEVIEIRHTALKRSVFAKGALAAAQFINGREKGLFSMEDMI